MTALIVIGCILLFFLLLGLLKVGVAVAYADKTPQVRVVAGPVKITLLPAKPKKEKKSKKEKKKKPEKPKKPKKPKKPGKTEASGESGEEKPKTPVTELLKRFVPPALNALNRFRRKLSIDRLTLHYTVASGDAAKTGESYGKISAIVGAVLPLLHQTFQIKKQDVRVDVSFVTTEPVIYADLQLTIAIWQIVYVGLAMLPALKKPKQEVPDKSEANQSQETDDTRKVENNGQAANQ